MWSNTIEVYAEYSEYIPRHAKRYTGEANRYNIKKNRKGRIARLEKLPEYTPKHSKQHSEAK
jgi:hypothetical protein